MSRAACAKVILDGERLAAWGKIGQQDDRVGKALGKMTSRIREIGVLCGELDAELLEVSGVGELSKGGA
jgi:hypothetical protein